VRVVATWQVRDLMLTACFLCSDECAANYVGCAASAHAGCHGGRRPYVNSLYGRVLFVLVE
jgi:hypothetical protein